MWLYIGTLNSVKINGVVKAFKEYYKNIKWKAIKPGVSLPIQPISLEEVFRSAHTRAKELYINYKGKDFYVGVEAGIFKLMNSWFVTQIVCVMDKNERYSYGISPTFPLPNWMGEKLYKNRNLELERIVDNIYDRKNVGEKEGFIGLLTKGKVDRENLTYLATLMALTYYLNREIYENTNNIF
jgi:inosine/xanthosine triphosphatase